MEKALAEMERDCERRIVQERFGGFKREVLARGCKPIWDGIMCWPAAKPDQILLQPCSAIIPGFDPNANASKLCTTTGWWINPQMNVSWTNYSDCYTGFVTLAPFPETIPLWHDWVPWVKATSRTGYIVSLTSLFFACSILLFNRKLRCPRNIIHLHLFLSFMMRAFIALLKDGLFVEGVGFSNSILYLTEEIRYTSPSHDWQCKVFTTFWQYFIMANYSWILVEGVYLHNLIFMALFSDTSSIFWYVFFGWTSPAFFVLPWAMTRVFYEDTFCWTTHLNQHLYLIIKIPTVVSIVVNFVLFLNITRVILLKLKWSSSFVLNRRITRYRKWAKSTLVLIPLYGVHYSLLLGLSYSSDPTVEFMWLFTDQLFASFQGLFVSILYCIINGEVVQVLKSNWNSFRLRLVNREEVFDMWRRCEIATGDDEPGYVNAVCHQHA